MLGEVCNDTIVIPASVNCPMLPSDRRKHELIYSVVLMVLFGGKADQIKM